MSAVTQISNDSYGYIVPRKIMFLGEEERKLYIKYVFYTRYFSCIRQFHIHISCEEVTSVQGRAAVSGSRLSGAQNEGRTHTTGAGSRSQGHTEANGIPARGTCQCHDEQQKRGHPVVYPKMEKTTELSPYDSSPLLSSP